METYQSTAPPRPFVSLSLSLADLFTALRRRGRSHMTSRNTHKCMLGGEANVLLANALQRNEILI